MHSYDADETNRADGNAHRKVLRAGSADVVNLRRHLTFVFSSKSLAGTLLGIIDHLFHSNLEVQ